MLHRNITSVKYPKHVVCKNFGIGVESNDIYSVYGLLELEKFLHIFRKSTTIYSKSKC